MHTIHWENKLWKNIDFLQDTTLQGVVAGSCFVAKKKPKAVPWGGETRTPNGNGGETAVGAELKIADTLVDADANEGKKHKKLGPFWKENQSWGDIC